MRRPNPGPQHPPAIVGQQALRREVVRSLTDAPDRLVVAAPVEPAVGLGDELLCLSVPISDVVPTAERVTDADQHPPAVKLEEVGTGDILAKGDLREIVAQEIADERPG